MNTDEILNQWAEDVKVDKTSLGEEQMRVGNLHSKYLRIFYQERAILLKMQEHLKRMKLLRSNWYLGTLSAEDMKQHNWPIQPVKIIKQDLQTYLDGDPVLSDIVLRVNLQNEKVNVVDQIIKHIQHRGYNLKSAIDWHKYQVGL